MDKLKSLGVIKYFVGMKVALYQPYIKERGGMEKVTAEIARRLDHDVTILTFAYDSENTFDSYEDMEVVEIDDFGAPDNFVEQAFNFGIKPLSRKIDTSDYDLLLISEAGLGSPITFRNHNLPVLGYTHTLLRAALPEFKETYREGFPAPLRLFYPLMVFGFNFLEKLTWRHYDFMFTNSELTKDRIRSKGLMGEDEMEVLNPGVDTEAENGEYENYFLYPSRFERYKRQDLAIKAFEEADLEDFELVLAGTNADPEYVEELREMAGENVRIETDVPDERWGSLNRNARAVVFLPENEDFGLVPIEAGTYSKPVIAVDEGTVRETVIDGETGFLVGAEEEQIAEKMKYFAEREDKAREMGKNNRGNAGNYSWEGFIERLDSKIEEMVD